MKFSFWTEGRRRSDHETKIFNFPHKIEIISIYLKLKPCNHFSRKASSALTTASISSILSEENEIAVLSAYIVAFARFSAKGRSLM